MADVRPHDSQVEEKLVSNDEIKQLVLERLKVLSPNTVFSVGSGESADRDALIKHVEQEDKIGEMFAEMQIEWIRSFKEAAA